MHLVPTTGCPVEVPINENAFGLHTEELYAILIDGAIPMQFPSLENKVYAFESYVI